MSELQTSEPVYQEGNNGFSANKMTILYDDTGMDLSNRELQLENVSHLKNLVLLRLRTKQNLKKRIIHMYISTAGKVVNNFNNFVTLKTIGVDEMISRTHEFRFYSKKAKKEKNPKLAQQYK